MNTALIPSPRGYINGQPVPSLATVRLHLYGATLRQVAAECGVTKPCVSMWFSGHVATPPRLGSALVRLVGRDAASLILEAIPHERNHA